METKIGLKKVAVVIVNWNGGELLKKCLEHLMQQTYRADQIFLMDNNSTDGSGSLAKSYHQVTLRELGKNFGFAVANNKAVLECNADYIALLNPDALADARWLEHLVTAATEMPNFSGFGSRQMQLYNKEKLDGLGDVYHISGLVWRKSFGRRMQVADAINSSIFSPCGCAVLYRADVYKKMGGFDEDYFCYVEDVDLGFRFNLAGYRSILIADAVVYHAGSATTGGSSSDFSIYYGHRNLIWTFVKNMPGLLFWILLPVHFLLNLFSVGYFTMRGKGNVILRAKLDALRGLAKMWRKRRQIQSQRKVSTMDIWRILDKSLIPKRHKE